MARSLKQTPNIGGDFSGQEQNLDMRETSPEEELTLGTEERNLERGQTSDIKGGDSGNEQILNIIDGIPHQEHALVVGETVSEHEVADGSEEVQR